MFASVDYNNHKLYQLKKWVYLLRQFPIARSWRFLLSIFRESSRSISLPIPASVRFTRQPPVNRNGGTQ